MEQDQRDQLERELTEAMERAARRVLIRWGLVGRRRPRRTAVSAARVSSASSSASVSVIMRVAGTTFSARSTARPANCR